MHQFEKIFLATAAGMTVVGALGSLVIKQQAATIKELDQTNCLLRLAVDKFIDYSTELDVIKRVHDEVKFEWVIKDVPEFKA